MNNELKEIEKLRNLNEEEISEKVNNFIISFKIDFNDLHKKNQLSQFLRNFMAKIISKMMRERPAPALPAQEMEGGVTIKLEELKEWQTKIDILNSQTTEKNIQIGKLNDELKLRQNTVNL